MGDDDPVTVPRWVAALALNDHRHQCPYCRSDREDLCRDGEFTDELRKALK